MRPTDRLCRNFAAIALLCAASPVFSQANTELRLVADVGHRIGEGQTLTVTPDDATIEITAPAPNAVEIRAEAPNGQPLFSVVISGPIGSSTPLAVGTYDPAEQFPFNGSAPGFNASVGATGCNLGPSRFQIYEISFDSSGALESLAFDATHTCFTGLEEMFIDARVNSSLAFGQGVSVVLPDTVNTDAGVSTEITPLVASSTFTGPLTYAWRQVAGEPVAITDPQARNLQFEAPVTDAALEVLQFELSVTDGLGRNNADVVTVYAGVVNPPTSSYRIRSLLQGTSDQDVEVVIDPAFLTINRSNRSAEVDYQAPDGQRFQLSVRPRFGDPLQVGQAGLAVSALPTPPTLPGFEFFLAGYCADASATYDILDVVAGANNRIDQFAVDLVVDCVLPDEVRRDLVQFRFNSPVGLDRLAPRANPGPDLVRFGGDTVRLDGLESLPGDAAITDFAWQQLSGPTVTLTGADTEAVQFEAPLLSAPTAPVVLALTVTDASNRSDTELVSVNVLAEGEPRNYLELIPRNPDSEPDVVGVDAFVGDGRRFDDFTGAFRATTNSQAANIDFEGIEEVGVSLGVGGADPSTLVPGVYQGVVPQQSNLPRIRLQTPIGRCEVGTFVVHEFARSDAFTIDTVAADLALFCGGVRIDGVLRINSTVPEVPETVLPFAGDDTVYVSGELVDLDGSASFVGLSGVTYQWTQLSGPAVTILDANAARSRFVAPDTTGTLVFQLTITDGDGNTYSDTVSVQLAASVPNTVDLYVESAVGEPLLRGETLRVRQSSTSFISVDENRIRFDRNSDPGLVLTLDSGDSAPLTPGVYGGAFSRDDNVAPAIPGRPNVRFEFDGEACAAVAGWFEIHEIEIGQDATTNLLAADFWQICDGETAPLFGAIRINSAVPTRLTRPRVSAGGPLIVRAGKSVVLDGSRSFTFGASLVGFEWQQVSGEALALSANDVASPTLSVPANTQPGQRVYALTVTNSEGETATDTAVVDVVATDAPLSAVRGTRTQIATGMLEVDVFADANTRTIEADPGRMFEPTSVYTAYGATDTIILIFPATSDGLPFAPGLYPIRADEFGLTPSLGVSIPGIVCSDFPIGWINIDAVDVASSEVVERIDFELRLECNDGNAVRIAANLNSPVDLEDVAPRIAGSVPTTVTEGDVIRLDTLTAVFPGELLLDKTWRQTAGAAVYVSRGDFGEDYRYVAPAVDGDNQIQLVYTAIGPDNTVLERTIDVQVLDNRITSLPVDVISTFSPSDSDAVGSVPIGVDVPGLIDLEASFFQLSAADGEPVRAPTGTIGFAFETSPGETRDVTVYFDFDDEEFPDLEWRSTSAPEQSATLNPRFAADLKSVTLTLTDGGVGDDDGVVDGVIRASGAVVTFTEVEPPPPPPPPSSPPPSGGGGGGGGALGPAPLALLAVWLLGRRRRQQTL